MNDEEEQNLLRVLKALSEKSDCDKIKFGCVITDGYHVIGEGWNHNVNRTPNWTCKDVCAGGIRRGVRSGTCVERCYAIHAEQHAILNCANIDPKELFVAGWFPDGTLFNNGGGFYCTVCARIMMEAGIEVVHIREGDHWKTLTMQQAWEDSYRIATAHE